MQLIVAARYTNQHEGRQERDPVPRRRHEHPDAGGHEGVPRQEVRP